MKKRTKILALLMFVVLIVGVVAVSALAVGETATVEHSTTTLVDQSLPTVKGNTKAKSENGFTFHKIWVEGEFTTKNPYVELKASAKPIDDTNNFMVVNFDMCTFTQYFNQMEIAGKLPITNDNWVHNAVSILNGVAKFNKGDVVLNSEYGAWQRWSLVYDLKGNQRQIFLDGKLVHEDKWCTKDATQIAEVVDLRFTLFKGMGDIDSSIAFANYKTSFYNKSIGFDGAIAKATEFQTQGAPKAEPKPAETDVAHITWHLGEEIIETKVKKGAKPIAPAGAGFEKDGKAYFVDGWAKTADGALEALPETVSADIDFYAVGTKEAKFLINGTVASNDTFETLYQKATGTEVIKFFNEDPIKLGWNKMNPANIVYDLNGKTLKTSGQVQFLNGTHTFKNGTISKANLSLRDGNYIFDNCTIGGNRFDLLYSGNNCNVTVKNSTIKDMSGKNIFETGRGKELTQNYKCNITIDNTKILGDYASLVKTSGKGVVNFKLINGSTLEKMKENMFVNTYQGKMGEILFEGFYKITFVNGDKTTVIYCPKDVTPVDPETGLKTVTEKDGKYYIKSYVTKPATADATYTAEDVLASYVIFDENGKVVGGYANNVNLNNINGKIPAKGTLKLFADIVNADNCYLKNSITIDLNGNKIITKKRMSIEDTVTFKNGTIATSSDSLFYIEHDKANLIIENATLSGGTTLLDLRNGDITLNNCTVNGEGTRFFTLGFKSVGGIFTINNCTFNSAKPADLFAVDRADNQPAHTLDVRVTNTTFSGTYKSIVYVTNGTKANETVKVSFDKDCKFITDSAKFNVSATQLTADSFIKFADGVEFKALPECTNLKFTFGDGNSVLLSRVNGMSIVAPKLLTGEVYLNLDEGINIVFLSTVNGKVIFNLNGELVEVTGVLKNGKYAYVFKNIDPRYIGDKITISLDGKATEVSIKEYCDAVLAKYGTNIETANLVNAILIYGAEAQKYTNYKTDALVTDKVLADVNFAGEKLALTPVENCTFIGAYVRLLSKATMYIEFTTTTPDTLTITVNNGLNKIEYTSKDFVKIGDNKYRIAVENINAFEFDAKVSVSVNGTEALVYSVNAYLESLVGTNAENLAKAMANYGACAKAYFEKI